MCCLACILGSIDDGDVLAPRRQGQVYRPSELAKRGACQPLAKVRARRLLQPNHGDLRGEFSRASASVGFAASLCLPEKATKLDVKLRHVAVEANHAQNEV